MKYVLRGQDQWRSNGDPSRLRGSRPGWNESQHHQYRQCSTEALYALCAAESSGRRRPPYPRRRGGRQRTLRRQNDGIESLQRARLTLTTKRSIRGNKMTTSTSGKRKQKKGSAPTV